MFYQIFDNEQFNFQVNRVLIYLDQEEVVKEIREIAPRITGFESWIKEWNQLGKKAEGEDIQRVEIPFEGAYMPAYKLQAKNEKGIMVVCGGFDSFIEEFYLVFKQIIEKGYTIIAFEGPGQGGARKNGLVFRYDWEVPIKAVLDYFNLEKVSLMGISWGGYLAPRAAAFDKRIKNVISYDIFYRGLDMLENRMPEQVFKKLDILLKARQKTLINSMLQSKMKDNIDLAWKLKQGMYITGTKTPYDFLKHIEQHDLSKVLDKITQNVLLLAGENDQYVPIKRFETIKQGLVHAKSVTGRIFTKEEHADQHCQVGNLGLVIDTIIKFLDEYPL